MRLALAIVALLAAGPAAAEGAPYECTGTDARGRPAFPGSDTIALTVEAPEGAADVLQERLRQRGFSGLVLPGRDGALTVLLDPAHRPDFEALLAPGQAAFHVVREDGTGLEAADPDGYPLGLEPEPFLAGGIDEAEAQEGIYGQPVVVVRLDAEATRVFGDASRTLIGRRIALLVDGRVLTAPMLREPILGGSLQIDGSFAMAEAEALAVLLGAGELPGGGIISEERAACPPGAAQ